ncbi:carbohydrate ABC transporter substrate-binding protein (CUT1 family) [Paenibacillus cellulosilyticus]|uniref:Carbohydrate ABC transporter substrate-binding protein (CUT1 family) n=1 Tax=Paenibacillus cellulosilyticus TaxID=375489 RepID=A0A2V2YZK7_9BACL|nr:extracellular solute-binding protein [Paenibacillus cellulosilyticus]PWW07227.1 carbohydrate ABC transporter substrate-binding protein (CUT1 family) [Paenibacillus cellulosilyticus]QKS44581.1 extracellular solute-binding protein [Paenibacillus cellulosilyticus]
MVTAILLVPMLATCASGDDTSDEQPPTKNNEEIIYNEPGLSKYDLPITLTFVRQTGDSLDDLLKQMPGDTLDNNIWTRLYEQVLGIRIKYEWTAKGDLYNEKLGVALAAGNLPDVVRVNAQQLRQLSNAGLIQDLTNVYNKYATPFTKEVLSQEGTAPFESATVDGKLMGIPETGSSIEGAQFIWIRTDWLDRLGLEPPRTMDDLLKISKAFTHNDPDGNGSNDTFGLAITQYLWDPIMGMTDFVAGYDAFPNIWIEATNGQLTYGAIQPEARTALQVLQNMYKDGQLDPEFMFKDGSKANEWITSGKVGMFYGEQWGSFSAQSSYSKNGNARWQAYPIVSDTGGLAKVPLRFATDQFLAVRKGYEHPEAIMKLLNLHLEKNWGQTAQYETYYSNPYPVWQVSPVTPYPALKNLNAYYQLEEARVTGDKSVLKDEARAIQKNIDLYLYNNNITGWGWEHTYGPTGAFSILDRYKQNNQLLYEKFVGPPTETMLEKWSLLEDMKNDTFVNIILGRPIADFDRFVEEWKRLGGAKITMEVNQWYVNKREQSRQ